ncbi:putative late blight resistance protein -like protein R1A-4-like [Capsicum annuum]|nr:putative late blight resistance protein -like protein R1A-4-like [Capsicum annuum]
MDDVWDTSAWDVVKRSFPDDKNGSRVILTSRIANIGIYASSGSPHYMRCLSVEESLRLFNLKVFGRETFPFELEKATKQIVAKCQGLPLTIVVVAGFCSKISKTENCWEDVAHKVGLIVNTDTEECLDLLALSYNHLPHHLKPCFLYMGAFPKGFEISVSRLIKLWIAAEYVRCKPEKDFEEIAEGYLSDLIGRSLIMVKKMTSSGKVKTCEVHDLLHDLILREVWKERSIYFAKFNVIVSPPVASFEHRIIFSFSVAPLTHIEHVYDISSLPRASSFLCFERDGTHGSCSQLDQTMLLGLFNNVNACLSDSPKLGIFGEADTVADFLPSETTSTITAPDILPFDDDDNNYSRRFLPFDDEANFIRRRPHHITRRVFEGMPNLKKLGIRESEEECLTAEQMSGKLKKLFLLEHLEAFKGFFIKPWILKQCDVFPLTLEKLT